MPIEIHSNKLFMPKAALNLQQLNRSNFLILNINMYISNDTAILRTLFKITMPFSPFSGGCHIKAPIKLQLNIYTKRYIIENTTLFKIDISLSAFIITSHFSPLFFN
jgi:hypothetical protein